MSTTTQNPPSAEPHATGVTWPSEVLIFQADDPAALAAQAERILAWIGREPDLRLADLAFTLNAPLVEAGATIALVAADTTELARRLTAARDHLRAKPGERLRDPSGSYYEPNQLARVGKLAVLFPGEGTQYQGMMAELPAAFAHVQQRLQAADIAIGPDDGEAASVSRFFSPPGTLSTERRELLERRLRQVDFAMFSVLTADVMAFEMLGALGVKAHALAGHSAGELAALSAAETIDSQGDAASIVAAMRDLGEAEERDEHQEAVLLATSASREALQKAIDETLPRELAAGPRQAVYVAMDNCPHQAVVVGLPEPMGILEAELKNRRIVCERLPFSRPYHTPLFAPFMGPLTEMFDEVAFKPPRHRVYSCTTAQPFPDDPEAIRQLALAHWSSPVEFRRLIETMHDDGMRLFVEAGPRGVLSAFVGDILRGREFLAVPCDQPRRSALTQWNHVVAQLAAHHVPVDPGYLYSSRSLQRLAEAPAAPVVPRPATARPAQPKKTGSGQVVARHMALMERFLDDQNSVMKEYLRARGGRRSAGPARQARVARSAPIAPPATGPSPVALQSPAAPVLPLGGSIIRHTPGVELLIRRRLDLSEDRYADDHAVGGMDVSRVNPKQRGMPVVPMTFILEMMAEAAVQLVPGHVAVAVGDVQIQRWLPVDEESVSTTEIEAKLVQNPATPGAVEVAVEVRDLGFSAEAGGTSRGTVAVGRVTLAGAYPAPPPASRQPFTNQQPARVTLSTLYRNLFHGPQFQGVRSLNYFGDEGLAATIEVLPRGGLFKSLADPRFLIDPVTVDVGMHPAAAWHLEQDDQSGRILLPFEMKKIEFFGPSPPVGTKLEVRNLVIHASPRQFTHAGEIAYQNGTLWCRLSGVKCWRFYLPLCEVNFNGPKDEYFVCKAWEAGIPRDEGRPARDVACVQLDPTGDLSQSAMQDAAARITLSDRELRTWRGWNDSLERRTAWLFGTISIKDATRIYWHAQTGARHFIADLDLQPDQYGRPTVRMRDGSRPAGAPCVALAQLPNLIVALAAKRRWAGVGLATLDSPDAAEFDPDEVDALKSLPGDDALRAAVASAARRALQQGLGPVLVPQPELLRVRAYDAATATLALELDASVATVYPEYQGQTISVSIVRDGAFVIATVLGPPLEGAT